MCVVLQTQFGKKSQRERKEEDSCLPHIHYSLLSLHCIVGTTTCCKERFTERTARDSTTIPRVSPWGGDSSEPSRRRNQPRKATEEGHRGSEEHKLVNYLCGSGETNRRRRSPKTGATSGGLNGYRPLSVSLLSLSLTHSLTGLFLRWIDGWMDGGGLEDGDTWEAAVVTHSHWQKSCRKFELLYLTLCVFLSPSFMRCADWEGTKTKKRPTNERRLTYAWYQSSPLLLIHMYAYPVAFVWWWWCVRNAVGRNGYWKLRGGVELRTVFSFSLSLIRNNVF